MDKGTWLTIGFKKEIRPLHARVAAAAIHHRNPQLFASACVQLAEERRREDAQGSKGHMAVLGGDNGPVHGAVRPGPGVGVEVVSGA